MYQAIAALVLILAAPAAMACCPSDPDTLASEAATMPGILDLISGKIERNPARMYLEQLAQAERAIAERPDDFEGYALAAEAADMLGRHYEATNFLERRRDADLTVAQRTRRDALRARMYMHQWLTELDPSPGAAESALNAARVGNPNRLWIMILEWAVRAEKADAERMLPDYFELRLAPNKTALADNKQLETMGLTDAPAMLIELLKLHPAWENVDTYYALSLALAVMGKQHLAYFARMRIYEMIEAGKTTRLTTPPEVRDLRALLVPRNTRTGVLAEIPALTDEARASIAAEYKRSRAEATMWAQEREAWGLRKMDQGASPARDAAFWQGFVFPQPRAEVPPPVPPVVEAAAPQGEEQGSGLLFPILGGVGATAVLVVVLAVTLRRRPEPAKE